MDSNIILSRESSNPLPSNEPYRQLVWQLLYSSTRYCCCYGYSLQIQQQPLEYRGFDLSTRSIPVSKESGKKRFFHHQGSKFCPDKNTSFSSSSSSSALLSTAAALLTSSNTSSSDFPYWIIDSGATEHMCNNRTYFSDFFDSPKNIKLANGDTISSSGYGTISCSVNDLALTLKNVLYVPSLKSNLLSISALANHDTISISETKLVRSQY